MKLILIFALFSTQLLAQNILQNQLFKQLKNQNLAGAVWAIVENGEIKTNSAGYANLASKQLMKPENKIHIGSIAKMILAVGILHLATEGKINLDESVQKYLPQTQLINKWNATNPVTVRHLLDHTSGLSDSKLWHIFSTSSTPNTSLSAFY